MERTEELALWVNREHSCVLGTACGGGQERGELGRDLPLVDGNPSAEVLADPQPAIGKQRAGRAILVTTTAGPAQRREGDQQRQKHEEKATAHRESLRRR